VSCITGGSSGFAYAHRRSAGEGEYIEEVSAYPDVNAMGDWRSGLALEEPKILVPFGIDLGGTELSLFTTLTVFGTPLDVTVAEIAVELFYPANDHSEALLRSMGGRSSTEVRL
jgi:hypothetical protein